MADITYEALNALYENATGSSTKPDMVLTTEAALRKYFGDEQVDAWIADGTVRTMDMSEVEDGQD